MTKSGVLVLVIFSVLIALCKSDEEKRDILNDLGGVIGKTVGKVWRTVIPKDIVEGSVEGASDQQWHGTPQGPPGFGPPGYGPPGGYYPPYGSPGYYPPPGYFPPPPGPGAYYY